MAKSQFDYLVDDRLRPRLERREQAAEIELAQRYNKHRRRQDRVAVPQPGDPYAKYHPRLLAILWSVAGNADGLGALGPLHELTVPPLPSAAPYAAMSDALLELVWTLGRDGQALHELWTRQCALPVQSLVEAPDQVLGFLAWYRQDAAALKELMYRHHQVRDTDASQDRVLVLIRVVPRWDYLNQPNLRPLLVRSCINDAISGFRRAETFGSLGESSEEEEQAAGPDLLAVGPQGVLEQREELESSPLELRAIARIKLNGENSPQDLHLQERDYLARRTLGDALEGLGDEELREQLDREGERIDRWMAENPRPTAKRIRTLLPWYNDSRFAIAARSFRVARIADDLARCLDVVVRGAPGQIGNEALRLREQVRTLARWPRERGGSVPHVGALTAGWMRLRQWLWSQDWDGAPDQAERDEARNECGRLVEAFLNEFPILLKLSACARLTDHLLAWPAPPPASGVLAQLKSWLDEGTWLSSFGEKDRAKSAQFAKQLRSVLPATATGRAPELLLHWLDLTEKAGAAPAVWLELEELRSATHAPAAASLARWADPVVQLIDLGLAKKSALLATEARSLAGQVSPNGSLGPMRAFQRNLDRLARVARGADKAGDVAH